MAISSSVVTKDPLLSLIKRSIFFKSPLRFLIVFYMSWVISCSVLSSKLCIYFLLSYFKILCASFRRVVNLVLFISLFVFCNHSSRAAFLLCSASSHLLLNQNFKTFFCFYYPRRCCLYSIFDIIPYFIIIIGLF